jgi:hypothetical protein
MVATRMVPETLNQQGLKLLLQRADLLADGGLRYIIDLSGLCETFRFGEVAKHF